MSQFLSTAISLNALTTERTVICFNIREVFELEFIGAFPVLAKIGQN